MRVESLDERATTVSAEDAATRLGCTPATLANKRYEGKGPVFCKVGSKVRYRLSDIAFFLDSCTRSSTSDLGPDA